MRILIEASRASFARGGEPVFRPVDVSLPAGRALVVRGRNGSGKTTLLRMLAGIIRPSIGTVVRHAPVAFFGHLPGFKLDLDCRENLDFRRRFTGAESGLDNDRALVRVGLAGYGLRPVRSLSAGQRRRLGLAALLVAPAAIWLLDEPYASLDDGGCELVDRLLAEHLARGGSVVMSTHQRQPGVTSAFETLEVDAYGEAA
jgi:heme exporter protein A